MESFVERLHDKAAHIQRQISAWHATMLLAEGPAALRDSGLSQEQVLAPLYSQLEHLYVSELPFAKLQDTSDLVIHAEGPAAEGSMFDLHSVNWIGVTVKRQLQRMTQAALPIAENIAGKIAKNTQWNLTGLIPGSIYMGFQLHRPPQISGFEVADDYVVGSIVSAVRSVSTVPQFINSFDVNPELADRLTDPAIRDAAMMAAMHLAPTLKSGLTSMEISSPGGDSGVLRYTERVVLREALRNPLMRRRQEGTFVGEMREIDLDSDRFQLRSVAGVGTLRCAMRFSADHAKHWIGQWVKVYGEFESDLDGRP